MRPEINIKIHKTLIYVMSSLILFTMLELTGCTKEAEQSLSKEKDIINPVVPYIPMTSGTTKAEIEGILDEKEIRINPVVNGDILFFVDWKDYSNSVVIVSFDENETVSKVSWSYLIIGKDLTPTKLDKETVEGVENTFVDLYGDWDIRNTDGSMEWFDVNAKLHEEETICFMEWMVK